MEKNELNELKAKVYDASRQIQILNAQVQQMTKLIEREKPLKSK